MESPTTKAGASFENTKTIYEMGPWTLRKTSWILDVPGVSILCAYLSLFFRCPKDPVAGKILLDFLFAVAAEVSAARRWYLTIVLFSSKGFNSSKA